MKTSYVGFFLLISHFTFGQLQENFNDGNFNSAPVWLGDTSFFKVNPDFQLQSKGPAASAVIHLSTSTTQLINTEWNFYIRLDFDPSTANYAKVYLSSDQSDLESSLQGYFVKIGGETGSTDGIDLYKQEGTTTTKLIDGTAGHAGKSLNKLRIKVIRDIAGNWSLFSDTSGAYNFIPEGHAFDNSITGTSHFGFVCIHSTTRKDMFYFDDLEIKTAPLSITGTQAINDTMVEISFNKEVEKTSAENPFNYILSTIGNPLSASRSEADPSKVSLSLADPLATGNYWITVKQLKDTGGIFIDSNTLVLLTYKKPLNYGDLLITEIFPDPSPFIGLPGEEFVELFNATADTINLSGFTLSDLSTQSILPFYKIEPSGYLILSGSSGISEFEDDGPVKGLTPWPSLNNTTDRITLKDDQGKIIFSVHYSLEWYRDEQKKEGGWSLEMIHPKEYCAGSLNWKASENVRGGTPGKQNSVFTNAMDVTAPYLTELEITDSTHITLKFNEALDTLIQASDLALSSAISISRIKIMDVQTINLTLSPPLETGHNYQLNFHNIKDCKGNAMNSSAARDFLLPESPDSLDIIINEVLFNPFPDGVDFVEIYNRSGKSLDLKNWELGNIKKDTVSDRKKIFTSSYIFPPGEYVCLTTDPTKLESQYYIPSFEKVIQVSALPSYNDESGTVLLYNSSGKISDRFDYHEDFHFPLIKKPEGISLERISFFAPSNTPHNWHSAAETAGYATPGYENSLHYEDDGDKTVSIEPKVFTPDQDAWKDLAFINYRFNEPGYIANITVYDLRGAPIKILARNQLLDLEGFFPWDGTNENGQLSTTGHYIVFFEAFNLKGEIAGYKRTVVLAQKF